VGSVVETRPDETALIVRARGGDVESFSALVRLYQDRAVRLAYSILGNWEDARDVAQEAFVKAYRSLGGFKAESRFSTWFHRILVNLCKDFLRKKKIRQGFGLFQKSSEEESSPEEAIPSPAPDPFRGVVNQELDQAIRGSLEKLPFRQRSVFALRYLEGLPLEAIANASGLTVGAVKANLWQAGEKMKKFLAPYLSDLEV